MAEGWRTPVLRLARRSGLEPRLTSSRRCTRLGLRVFDIDGGGPYDRDGFVGRVLEEQLWTWVATR